MSPLRQQNPGEVVQLTSWTPDNPGKGFIRCQNYKMVCFDFTFSLCQKYVSLISFYFHYIFSVCSSVGVIFSKWMGPDLSTFERQLMLDLQEEIYRSRE
jgi:hypothetical protein